MRSLSASIRFLLQLLSGLSQSCAAGDRFRALTPNDRARRRGLPVAQRVEQGLGRRPVQILVEVIVDLQDRRIHAGAEALDLDQAEKPVRRGAAHAYAELAFASLDDRVGAA